jgi:hypothetical protein
MGGLTSDRTLLGPLLGVVVAAAVLGTIGYLAGTPLGQSVEFTALGAGAGAILAAAKYAYPVETDLFESDD